MKIEILHVPDCPHLRLLGDRLEQALDADPAPGRHTITHVVVTDLDAAVATGMTGSPTLLVDGTDPFAEPGSAASVSCRLYRDADGRISGAPSVAALRHVIAASLGRPKP